MQLDDWVLCRIYNKKGTLEKHETKLIKYPEIDEMEERKPEFATFDHTKTVQSVPQPPQQSAVPLLMMDYSAFDTSESGARLHADSSSSEHVLSPEFTYEREREREMEGEVQSEPKWNELENVLSNSLDFPFYMDDFSDDPFAPQVKYTDHQLSPLQDIFMFMQKPY